MHVPGRKRKPGGAAQASLEAIPAQQGYGAAKLPCAAPFDDRLRAARPDLSQHARARLLFRRRC
jgi:hypothetical protein